MQLTKKLPAQTLTRLFALLAVLLIFLASGAEALAHNVAEGDKGYIQESSGALILPFIYLGAKHMVTGYDHLLFLFGVIFFLFRLKDVGIYVTLFAFGHSATLLFGFLTGISANAYLIDAIIGLSVVYKGFDNLKGFEKILGFSPQPKVAVLVFGLFHGLGLATKLQDFQLPQDGLFLNLLSFNLGVELGQCLALGLVLLALKAWRKHKSYLQMAQATQILLMTGGFALLGYHLTGYLLART